jgi:cytochrome b involved in lipid metabolism
MFGRLLPNMSSMNLNKIASLCLFAFVCVFVFYTILGSSIKESAKTVLAKGVWSKEQNVLNVDVVHIAQKRDTAQTPIAPKRRGYTIGDVRRHNSKPSCWSVINNSVYDLTSLIYTYPGGQESIFSLCGKDGTQVFLNAHADDRDAMHSLSDYRIGDLIE